MSLAGVQRDKGLILPSWARHREGFMKEQILRQKSEGHSGVAKPT
jgi:hypothetical protein